jgi:hypothetical protein
MTNLVRLPQSTAQGQARVLRSVNLQRSYRYLSQGFGICYHT